MIIELKHFLGSILDQEFVIFFEKIAFWPFSARLLIDLIFQPVLQLFLYNFSQKTVRAMMKYSSNHCQGCLLPIDMILVKQYFPVNIGLNYKLIIDLCFWYSY